MRIFFLSHPTILALLEDADPAKNANGVFTSYMMLLLLNYFPTSIVIRTNLRQVFIFITGNYNLGLYQYSPPLRL